VYCISAQSDLTSAKGIPSAAGGNVTVGIVDKAPTSTIKPTTLVTAFAEIQVKRAADVTRFRTCCADPRASK
jgi:hypothetical protein